jgi:Icc-related predicted phosphoesterase
MTKKLRLLAAADIEGDSKLTKKLAELAEEEEVDLVVLCGDIVGWKETTGLIKPFKDKNKPVLILPGNHDSFATTDFMANLYGVKNIHGYSAVYEGIGLFGAGGADLAPGFISERELWATLKKAHEPIKSLKTKIMLTHMHPFGSMSEWSGFEGSKSIRKAIKEFKPDFLLHGHIHEAAGADEMIDGTRVINVGREGRIIEI